MSKIVIAGGGLCGALAGAYLASNGYEIEVLERRTDLRLGTAETGRSINLALSARGIKALGLIGLDEELKLISIPMPVRALHQKDGTIYYVPYSGRSGEYINSISRTGLNALLLEKLSEFKNVKISFEAACTQVDFKNKFVGYSSNGGHHSTSYDFLMGTDGAASVVRKNLYEQPFFSHTFQQEFLDYGYKELHIDPLKDGGFAIEKNALHIWPRGHLMMIALPNLDGSFTLTLFLPMKGEDSFETIDSGLGIKAYFEKHFNDATDLMPTLEQQYQANPIGHLGTIKCSPWSFNNVCIMGDAAHAITPFYGQGMNCAFEDMLILSELMKQRGGLSAEVLHEFQQNRKQDTDAIADLAIDNFYEMRDHTANPIFLKKRMIETALEKTYPDYYSKYSMVTFRDDMSYHEAMTRGRKQDAWLMQYAESNEFSLDNLNLIYNKLKEIF